MAVSRLEWGGFQMGSPTVEMATVSLNYSLFRKGCFSVA
jgi:hypothetical protein